MHAFWGRHAIQTLSKPFSCFITSSEGVSNRTELRKSDKINFRFFSVKKKYKSKKRRPCYHNTVCAKLFKKHFSKSISKRYQGNFMRTVGVLRALHAFLVKPPIVFYRFLRFSVKMVTVIGSLRLILQKTVTVISSPRLILQKTVAVIGSLRLILQKTVTVIGSLRLILRKTVTVIGSLRLVLRKTVTVIASLILVQERNRCLSAAKGLNRTERIILPRGGQRG